MHEPTGFGLPADVPVAMARCGSTNKTETVKVESNPCAEGGAGGGVRPGGGGAADGGHGRHRHLQPPLRRLLVLHPGVWGPFLRTDQPQAFWRCPVDVLVVLRACGKRCSGRTSGTCLVMRCYLLRAL